MDATLIIGLLVGSFIGAFVGYSIGFAMCAILHSGSHVPRMLP